MRSCPFAKTWMDLEGVILSEVSQTEKKKTPFNFTYMQNLKNKTKLKQTHKQRTDWWLPQGRQGGGMGETREGKKISENV